MEFLVVLRDKANVGKERGFDEVGFGGVLRTIGEVCVDVKEEVDWWYIDETLYFSLDWVVLFH